MTMKVKIGLAVAVVAALATFRYMGSADKSQQMGSARPPAPVSIVMAISNDVPLYLDEIGKCVARELVSIQPQVSGRITAIHFADGSDVRMGDTLFTIDPRPYRAGLQAAEADLAQANSAFNLAKLQFDRAAKLLESNNISQSDYDTAKNSMDGAEAQAKRAEAAAQNARLNLEYCFIRSPIDGRAGRRMTDIGNVVSPATGSLLTIERMDPIYADFTINENDLPAVQKNMSQGSLRVDVRLPNQPDSVQVGKLTFLDNMVQPASGTVQLRATIPNSRRHLWPGQFVQVRVVLNTIKGAVLVPSTASMVSAKGPFVFVVKDDTTAEMRPVSVGQRQGEMVVLTTGVKAGERIIVNGQLAVAPGAKVRITETKNADGSVSQAKGAGQ